jgi:uncharacterized protein
MGVLYCKKAISEQELIVQLQRIPEKNDWIVEDDFCYDDYVDSLLAKNEYNVIDIKTLKMFTTTNCNLRCDYCLIEKNLNFRGSIRKNLSLQNGIDVLERFSELSMKQKHSKKTIMLYGGEPLLNWNNVAAFIRFIREKETKGLFNGDVEIILESNGTLVTDEVAEYLKKNDVFVIVSIDGTRDVHNAYRKKADMSGSYDETKRGFDILIQHGCTTVISSVFTDEYAKNIDACICNMIKEIRPKSIGLNLFHVLEHQSIKNDKTSDIYYDYIHAFELARDNDLYIEHIMRRIRPLVDRKVRIKDCGACGNRIVSDVNGYIGICEGLVGNSKYFFPRRDFAYVKTDNEFRIWAQRTPLKIQGCKGCPAMGICGAGCVNNAIQQNGNIFSPDNYICATSKAFVLWALRKWFTDNKVEVALQGKDCHVLTERERLSLLGRLRLEYNLPLQTMSKQYEVQIQRE